MPGSLVLVGGEPGIGKSTLLLQVLDAVGAQGAARPVMLVCGEESPAQVKMRAERICVAPGVIQVLAETELETILEVLEERRPALVVVDSVQTLYSDELSSAPGSVTQVREATSRRVFRRKPNTDSAPSRTLIPRQAEHRFRSKPNTDSARSRTVSRLRAEAMTGR